VVQIFENFPIHAPFIARLTHVALEIGAEYRQMAAQGRRYITFKRPAKNAEFEVMNPPIKSLAAHREEMGTDRRNMAQLKQPGRRLG